MLIKEDTKLIPQEGFTLLELAGKQELVLDLAIENNCNVLIRITDVCKLTVKGKVAQNVRATLFFWNECDCALENESDFSIAERAELSLGYLECNLADSMIRCQSLLNGADAACRIASASLVNSRKDYQILLENACAHTNGSISNYAVVLDKGQLQIDAVGKIDAGAYKSRSHQVSRALTFAQGSQATILPELLISENDVEASHALSIGRMDESQLYYMMSRGLDLKECMKLVALGYLLPICDIIEDESFRSQLQGDLERKISELCLM